MMYSYGGLPTVYMLTKAIRQKRSLINYRQSVVKRITQSKNIIRDLLQTVDVKMLRRLIEHRWCTWDYLTSVTNDRFRDRPQRVLHSICVILFIKYDDMELPVFAHETSGSDVHGSNLYDYRCLRHARSPETCISCPHLKSLAFFPSLLP